MSISVIAKIVYSSFGLFGIIGILIGTYLIREWINTIKETKNTKNTKKYKNKDSKYENKIPNFNIVFDIVFTSTGTLIFSSPVIIGAITCIVLGVICCISSITLLIK